MLWIVLGGAHLAQYHGATQRSCTSCCCNLISLCIQCCCLSPAESVCPASLPRLSFAVPKSCRYNYDVGKINFEWTRAHFTVSMRLPVSELRLPTLPIVVLILPTTSLTAFPTLPRVFWIFSSKSQPSSSLEEQLPLSELPPFSLDGLCLRVVRGLVALNVSSTAVT